MKGVRQGVWRRNVLEELELLAVLSCKICYLLVLVRHFEIKGCSRWYRRHVFTGRKELRPCWNGSLILYSSFGISGSEYKQVSRVPNEEFICSSFSSGLSNQDQTLQKSALEAPQEPTRSEPPTHYSRLQQAPSRLQSSPTAQLHDLEQAASFSRLGNSYTPVVYLPHCVSRSARRRDTHLLAA